MSVSWSEGPEDETTAGDGAFGFGDFTHINCRDFVPAFLKLPKRPRKAGTIYKVRAYSDDIRGRRLCLVYLNKGKSPKLIGPCP